MRASLLQQLPPREQIDELWAAVAQSYDKVVVRDWAYLDWRYQRHPFAQYLFLEVRDENDSLKALGVVRADDRQVRLVDYIGPAASAALKSAVVDAMLREWPNAASYSAMTSDLELKQVMKAHGFYQGREQPPRFFLCGNHHSEFRQAEIAPAAGSLWGGILMRTAAVCPGSVE